MTRGGMRNFCVRVASHRRVSASRKSQASLDAEFPEGSLPDQRQSDGIFDKAIFWFVHSAAMAAAVGVWSSDYGINYDAYANRKLYLYRGEKYRNKFFWNLCCILHLKVININILIINKYIYAYPICLFAENDSVQCNSLPYFIDFAVNSTIFKIINIIIYFLALISPQMVSFHLEVNEEIKNLSYISRSSRD
ncbi:hypothetical protein PUN28_010065 [Cardiocondyla obscurior]|uniref:Uncharacterized protein n=1 Tax=Cardiocondyla obscurior TaxID=286306 RepID=A0AAW2FNC0_9HYME